MIPEFPNFKKLELSDKEDVEKFTSKFPPYSDFDFVSMWSWDIKGEMRISQLYTNLVVRFTDYLTGEPFYSFLGNNKVNETAEILLNSAVEEEIKPRLCLVPNDSIEGIMLNKFKVEEDLDNFDYIYDLNEISRYTGNQFVKKRNKIVHFLKLLPGIKVEILNINNKSIKDNILKLDEFWLKNKTQKDANFKIKNEFLATNRFFESAIDNTFGVGIFVNKKLIGYSILGLVANNYAISHFCKADTQFIGIYDFLMRETAKILVDKGYLLLNYEQDLGLPGLRENKKSFMSKYLRKFTVGFTH